MKLNASSLSTHTKKLDQFFKQQKKLSFLSQARLTFSSHPPKSGSVKTHPQPGLTLAAPTHSICQLNPTTSRPHQRLLTCGTDPRFSSVKQESDRPTIDNTARIHKPNRVLWQPSAERVASSQMNAFRVCVNEAFNLNLKTYADLHHWSVQNKALFWPLLAQFSNIKFHTPPKGVFVPGKHFQTGQWFPGARLNFSQNMLQHAHINGEKTAIVAVLEDGTRVELSFKALEQRVGLLMHFLRNEGVGIGDRVAAIMPNVSETVIGMLATTGIGAIWTSCSPDFGPQSILDRFGQTQPKVLIASDGYCYKGNRLDIRDKIRQVAEQIPSIHTTITVPVIGTEHPVGILWDEAVNGPGQGTDRSPDYEPVAFSHPGFILYSSGTTGKPKCITHSVGGTLLQHAKELRLHTDLSEKDKHFFFTTCGWMMWNWLTSTMQTGASTILYDGNPFYPKNDCLIQLIEQEKITAFGAGARYYAQLEQLGVNPSKHFDLSSLRTVMSTGSPLNPASYHYIYSQFKEDVCLASISGGTDIISCFALGNPTLPVREGELQCLGLGMDVDIYNERGESVKQEKGELVCKSPFPSMPVGFWGDDSGEKYQTAYFNKFENIWAHGDFAELTTNAGLIIHGRSDTILNPGGVRIGTAEIYRQLEKINEIQESVVVDQAWEGDTRIVLFVRLNAGAELTQELDEKIKNTIRNNTSPRHVPAVIAAVADIPRTFSGKTVEMAVKNVINKQTVSNLGAIANPESLELFKQIPGVTGPLKHHPTVRK